MKKLQFGILVLLIFSLLAGCKKKEEQKETATIYAVNTTKSVKGRIQNYLRLSGDIIASSTVDAYSDVAGKVSSISVVVGDRVRKDDPIAEVDPSRPGMTYIPGVVKAPITGTIVSLPAQIGMTITQAFPIARLSGGSGLEIRLFVAERFLSLIALRLACEITVDAYPGEKFRGSISEIFPTVDPASRTMEIRVNVENHGAKLKAGMFANVKIITEQKENIVKIPAAAMISRFGEHYLFTIDKTDPASPVARKKNVVPGILIDGVVEINEGIAPDEEIVVRGQTLLEDGARINVVETTAPLSVN